MKTGTKHPEVISVISKHLSPNPHDERHIERRGITLTFNADAICTQDDPYGGEFGDYVMQCYDACKGINPEAVPESNEVCRLLCEYADERPQIDKDCMGPLYAIIQKAHTAIAKAERNTP